MKTDRVARAASVLVPLALSTAAVIAEEKHEHDHGHENRQQEAHVHGIAALNVALEGTEVHVELDSPAANIVGFEHAPTSESDHAALDKAVAALTDGERLFRFNAEAGCRLDDVKIASALLDEKHDDHAHSDEPGHAEKGGHEEHADEHEGEVHSDIEAAYHFECDQPGKLTRLTVELFEAFPGTEELDVQYVIESKQGAAELTPAEHVVAF
jgi:hypothetical protein